MNYRFNVCDLNAIETRAAAWLAGCIALSDVFIPRPGLPNGRDPYLAFACYMFGRTYDDLYADYKGKNGKERKKEAKRMRQIAKPAVLGAIYRLSGGQWGRSKKGYVDHTDDCPRGKKCIGCPKVYDRVKTGLWGYADNMGVEMTQEQANIAVRVFRDAYPEIPAFWKILEEAVIDVLKGSQTVRRVGPNGCVQIDKITVNGEYDILRMRLPSGRYLHYINARIESCQMPWKRQDSDEHDYRDAMVYAGIDQDTKQWDIWIQTHGGKLFENLVQAIARDILAVKLLEFEAHDLFVVGHVHDEGISLVRNDPFSPGLPEMIRMMSAPVDWCPGLLLGADGFEDVVYHK